MNREEQMWWERTRAKGKRRFILLYFGAVLGFIMGTVTAFGTKIYTNGLALQAFASPRFLLEWGLRVVIGFITGCLLGMLVWWQNEKRYQGK